MIKAVIFDMFETLVTLFAGPVYFGKQIAAEIGIPEAKFREIWDTTDNDRTLGKRALEDVIEEVLRVNNCYSIELFDQIIIKRKAMLTTSFENIHSEILPLFDLLKEQNIKIGLITNCYFEERDFIRNSELSKYFDVMCMSCELGVKKPDVAIFYKCLKELNLIPKECIYVGDGGCAELETARDLGMHALQAVWYLKDELKQSARNKADKQSTRSKAGFVQVESPLDLIEEMNKI